MSDARDGRVRSLYVAPEAGAGPERRDEARVVEGGIAGETLGVGDARLRVTRDRPPCSHLESTVGVDGVASALRGRAGVCAEVVTPGTVGVGDPVWVVEASPRETGRAIAARLRSERAERPDGRH